MKNRYILLGITALILVIIVAGVMYATRFANAVNQPHTAPGAITATATTTSTPISSTGTPISSTSLQTFQIVPAQTTASYSVFENLIFQNKPNNDAIGTTHSVQGSFRIGTGASPLVESMNVTVDLRTLQSDSQMRDKYVLRNSLQTDTYPTATFVSVSTQGLPASYSDGQSRTSVYSRQIWRTSLSHKIRSLSLSPLLPNKHEKILPCFSLYSTMLYSIDR